MKERFIRCEWLSLIILLLPFLYIAVIWNQIPEIIPTHFNIEGKPDAYSNKVFGTMLLPFINGVVYLILLFLPRMDPRYNNYSKFNKTYRAIRMVVLLFMSFLSIAVVQIALKGSVFSVRLISVVAFLMIAALGYFLPGVKSNFFVGIRTPWTLSNETVWKKTHELGGKVFLYGGIAASILLLVSPVKYFLWIIFPSIVFIVVVPVIYSYMEYRKLRQRY